MPLLLTKLKVLLYDNPLGSWETRKRKEKKKEEREGKGSELRGFALVPAERNHQENLGVFQLFKVIS